jgi:hypothetical protein
MGVEMNLRREIRQQTNTKALLSCRLGIVNGIKRKAAKQCSRLREGNTQLQWCAGSGKAGSCDKRAENDLQLRSFGVKSMESGRKSQRDAT